MPSSSRARSADVRSARAMAASSKRHHATTSASASLCAAAGLCGDQRVDGVERGRWSRRDTRTDKTRKNKRRCLAGQPMTFVAPTGLTLSFIGALSAWTIKSGVPFRQVMGLGFDA